MTSTLDLKRATWKDYSRFVHLCCVPTIPYHGGQCWILGDDFAFIGYSYPFRNNRLRNRIFPVIQRLGKTDQCEYLNSHFRILSRLMVKPENRGRGLASSILSQTLPLIGNFCVECLTFEPIICHLLATHGFQNYGWSKTSECYYYIKSPWLLKPVSTAL